jgi:hypothetical protein
MRDDGFHTSYGEFLSYMSTKTLFIILENLKLERQSIVTVGIKKDIGRIVLIRRGLL